MFILLTSLVLSLSSACLWATVNVAYNPSIFHRLLTTDEIKIWENSLKLQGLTSSIFDFKIPANTRHYHFKKFVLGKDYNPNFLQTNADIGLVTTHEYLDLKSLGSDIRPLAFFSEEGMSGKGQCTQDAHLVVPLKSSLKSVKDLKGKKIGVVFPEQSTMYAVKSFLMDHPDLVSALKPASSVQDLKRMLKDNEVDAALESFYDLEAYKVKAGIFKREINPDFKQGVIYKGIAESHYKFPCFLIYGKNNLNKNQTYIFLKNFQEKMLMNLKIPRFDTELDPKTLKRLDEVMAFELAMNGDLP